MNKPFDATMNSLIDLGPAEWAGYLAARLGIPFGTVEVIDTDLSATVQADKVFRINGTTRYLLHLELESSSHLEVPARVMRYNVLLRHQSGLPVYSLLMLLRPSAAASDQGGTYRARGIHGETIHEFRYTVMRVWEESTAGFLTAGVSFAPLALITNEAAENPQRAYGLFRERLGRNDVSENVAREVLGLSSVLCGLRYDETRIKELFMGGHNVLEDSVVYQSLVRRGEAQGLSQGLLQGLSQGRLENAKEVLKRLGLRKFGAIEPRQLRELDSLAEIERLERMTDRIFDAASWADLLGTL